MEDGRDDMAGHLPYHYGDDLYYFSAYRGLAHSTANTGHDAGGGAHHGIHRFTVFAKIIA